MESRIVLSERDAMRVRALLAGQRRVTAGDREDLLDLQAELDRASIVEPQLLPSNVIALDSTAIVLDLESGLHNHYTLVLPAEADASEGRISVLAPLGTALLGYRAGEEVEWRMPGGLRRLRIEAVQHAQRTGDDPASARRLAA